MPNASSRFGGAAGLAGSAAGALRAGARFEAGRRAGAGARSPLVVPVATGALEAAGTGGAADGGATEGSAGGFGDSGGATTGKGVGLRVTRARPGIAAVDLDRDAASPSSTSRVTSASKRTATSSVDHAMT